MIRYRIDYRNYVLNDISHERKYHSSEIIRYAYRYQKSLPSPTCSLYSRIELKPKLPNSFSKSGNLRIPCGLIRHTAKKIYCSILFYIENGDKIINIHIPTGNDNEITCYSFKPINKSIVDEKDFMIINERYEMYI